MSVFGNVLILISVVTGSMTSGPGVPENITVTFLSPTAVKVSWSTTVDTIEKYDVTYKPTDARVVAVVAGNSDTVTLSGLKADTQYQLTVAAVWGGKKYRSRPIVFRTLELPSQSPSHQDFMASPSSEITTTTSFQSKAPPDSSSAEVPDYLYPSTSSTVRGVEIGIVLLVLFVWVAAIALFFNRWGKIRMLLPYQPDYKQDQLKVPGSAACSAAAATASATAGTSSGTGIGVAASGATCTHQHSFDQTCPQGVCTLNQASSSSRPRLNSAIFVSNSGPGIDPKEFFRRHGSVSRLCRRTRSVENLSTMTPVATATSATHHFGLPILSVSGPSPPNDDQLMIYEEEGSVAEETDRFLS